MALSILKQKYLSLNSSEICENHSSNCNQFVFESQQQVIERSEQFPVYKYSYESHFTNWNSSPNQAFSTTNSNLYYCMAVRTAGTYSFWNPENKFGKNLEVSKRYHCPDCNSGGNNSKEKPIENYQCPDCDFTTNWIGSFNLHRRWQHYCGIEYNESSEISKYNSFETHQESVNVESETNFPPNVTLEPKTELSSRKSPKKRFQCDRCDFSTNWKKSIKNHRERQHMNAEFYLNYDAYKESQFDKPGVQRLKIFRCSYCKYASKWPGNLKDHKARKHGIGKVHTCPVKGCGYRTARMAELKSHGKIHQKPKEREYAPRQKIFKCEFEGCNYITAQKQYLSAHSMKHKKLKPYQCRREGCFFSTAWKYYLKSHEVKHANKDFKPK